jgi:hypothetical protein
MALSLSQAVQALLVHAVQTCPSPAANALDGDAMAVGQGATQTLLRMRWMEVQASKHHNGTTSTTHLAAGQDASTKSAQHNSRQQQDGRA